jgi:hypothetical protein
VLLYDIPVSYLESKFSTRAASDSRPQSVPPLPAQT